MSDNNVIEIFTTSDGKLVRKEDIPQPGTDEWIKGVLINLIRSDHIDKDKAIASVELIANEGMLPLFMKQWTGDLIDLLATPAKDYHAKGRPHLPEDLPESSGDVDFSTAMISDLCRYYGKDDSFISGLWSNLNRGQIYTFVISLSQSVVAILNKRSGINAT